MASHVFNLPEAERTPPVPTKSEAAGDLYESRELFIEYPCNFVDPSWNSRERASHPREQVNLPEKRERVDRIYLLPNAGEVMFQSSPSHPRPREQAGASTVQYPPQETGLPQPFQAECIGPQTESPPPLTFVT